MDIYASMPVNKSAAIVTSQSGCSYTFQLGLRETYEILKERRTKLGHQLTEMRVRMGIDSHRENGGGKRKKFPKHILHHPEYKTYLVMKHEAFKADKELYELKLKIKSEEDAQNAGHDQN